MNTVLMALIEAFPNPPAPTPPPFANGFLQLIAIVQWVALGLSILGLIIVGARMAISLGRGEGAQQVGALGWWAFGAFLIGGAVAIGGFVYTATAA